MMKLIKIFPPKVERACATDAETYPCEISKEENAENSLRRHSST